MYDREKYVDKILKNIGGIVTKILDGPFIFNDCQKTNNIF